MTMYLHGTMEERNCDGEGCDTCPYQAITVDLAACELERGSSYVHLAARLWSLADPDRAKKLALGSKTNGLSIDGMES